MPRQHPFRVTRPGPYAPHALRRCARPGFTIVELLVVSAISVLLMTVGVTVYLNCLKIYREGQGVTNVYETAKLVNRDLRDLLGNVVPVPGDWINTSPLKVRRFGGGPNTPVVPDVGTNMATENGVDVNYSSWFGDAKSRYYSNVASGGWAGVSAEGLDKIFSGPQDKAPGYSGEFGNEGYQRRSVTSGWGIELDPSKWKVGMNNQYASDQNNAWKGWWMPGFYGKRNGLNATVLAKNDYQVGSWGWPRADYRLDADADDSNKRNVACWFYAEDRFFNSPYTLTLDNANIVLASIKFTLGTNADGNEETQLSFLTHHITGFDHPTHNGNGLVRSDAAYGNMMRQIKITPYYLNDGALTEMQDAEIGASLSGVPGAPNAGDKMPRCFDVRYSLRNLANNQRFRFVLRAYCYSNPH